MTLWLKLEAAFQAKSQITLVTILREHQSLPSGDYYRSLSIDTEKLKEQSSLFKSGHCPDSSYWTSWGPLIEIFSWPRDRLSLEIPPKAQDQRFLGYLTMDLRKGVRDRLLTWLCDPLRSENLFLIFELCLGESRLAFSEAAVRVGRVINRLGAISNISPWVKRHELYGLAQDICGQLSRNYPPYRKLLAETLVQDPTLFQKRDLNYLLRKLIFEPWKDLKTSHPQYVVKPPIIFLTWGGSLSAESNAAILDFLQLITEDRHSNSHSCLLWVWIGPWVPLFSTVFSQDPLRCQQIRDLVGSNAEVVEYTEAILLLRFQEIRGHHPGVFDMDEKWPLKDELK